MCPVMPHEPNSVNKWLNCGTTRFNWCSETTWSNMICAIDRCRIELKDDPTRCTNGLKSKPLKRPEILSTALNNSLD